MDIAFLLSLLANVHSRTPICVHSLERHLMSCTCCVSAFYSDPLSLAALLLLCHKHNDLLPLAE